MERQSGRAKKRESQRHIRRCAREPPAPCCARDTPTPAIALAHIHEPGRPVLGAVAGDQHVRRPVARNPATPQHEFAFLRWRCCGVGEGMWRGNGGGGRGGGIDSELGYRGGKKQPTRDATADQNARATIQQLLRHAKSRPMSPAAGEIGPVLQPGPVSSSLHMSLPLTPVARAVSLDLSRPVSRADTKHGEARVPQRRGRRTLQWLYCRELACAWRRRFAASTVPSAHKLRVYGSQPLCKTVHIPRCPRAGGEDRSAARGGARAGSWKRNWAATIPPWTHRFVPQGWPLARIEPGACNLGVRTWRSSLPHREAPCAPCSGSRSCARRRADRKSRISGSGGTAARAVSDAPGRGASHRRSLCTAERASEGRRNQTQCRSSPSPPSRRVRSRHRHGRAGAAGCPRTSSQPAIHRRCQPLGGAAPTAPVATSPRAAGLAQRPLRAHRPLA
jgi:hypothetical protein